MHFASQLVENLAPGPGPVNSTYAWIGLFAPTETADFQWVTGESVVYTNWAPGEPNFFETPLWQFVHYWTRDFGDGPLWSWNNDGNEGFMVVENQNRYGFIVEWDVPQEPDPCTLNLTPSITEGTLTLDVQLGTQEPATWNVWLIAQAEVTPVVSSALPVIEPPASVELNLPFFPALGTVGFLTTLTTPVQGIICSAFVTVDTGPSEPAATSSPQVLQDLLAPSVKGLHDQLLQQHIR